jgi:hypothetical protein
MSGSASKMISRRAFPAGDAPRACDDTAGYGHIHHRMFQGSPSHAPRGSPTDATKDASEEEAAAGRLAG